MGETLQTIPKTSMIAAMSEMYSASQAVDPFLIILYRLHPLHRGQRVAIRRVVLGTPASPIFYRSREVGLSVSSPQQGGRVGQVTRNPVSRGRSNPENKLALAILFR